MFVQSPFACAGDAGHSWIVGGRWASGLVFQRVRPRAADAARDRVADGANVVSIFHSSPSRLQLAPACGAAAGHFGPEGPPSLSPLSVSPPSPGSSDLPPQAAKRNIDERRRSERGFMRDRRATAGPARFSAFRIEAVTQVVPRTTRALRAIPRRWSASQAHRRGARCRWRRLRRVRPLLPPRAEHGPSPRERRSPHGRRATRRIHIYFAETAVFRFVKNDGERCAGLDSSVQGAYPCRLYARRPDDCRIVQPGLPACLEARRLGQLGSSVEFTR